MKLQDTPEYKEMVQASHQANTLFDLATEALDKGDFERLKQLNKELKAANIRSKEAMTAFKKLQIS